MNRSIRIRAALAVLVGSVAAVMAVAAPAGAATHTPRGHVVAHAAHANLATKSRPVKPAAPKPATGSGTHANTVRANAWSLSLTDSPDVVLVTQYVTITATANQPIPAGDHITIWDDSDTSTIIADCTSGSTCSGSTTHDEETFGLIYAAITSGNDTLASSWTYPTWNPVDINKVTADQTTLGVGGTVTLTATTSNDIGPTYLFLEFFDTTTGQWVGQCDGLNGDGLTCVKTVSQSTAGTHAYVAYLTVGATSSYPPSNVEWQSYQTTYATWTSSAYRVSLTVDEAGSYDTPTILTATANAEVDAPYFITVYNEATGTLVGSCSGSTTCHVTDADPPQTFDEYVAFVSSFGTAMPPRNIQASSAVDEVFVRPIP